jgi:hypothetical protein
MSDILLGVIIGSVLSIAAGAVTEIIRGNGEASLDREKRRDDRRLAETTFQRQTLLDVQEALLEWARLNQMHAQADRAAFKQTGVWGKNLVGPELSEREMNANRRLALLKSRIRDDGLRARIGDCQNLEFQILMAPDRETADAINPDLALAIEECLTTAGDLARNLW